MKTYDEALKLLVDDVMDMNIIDDFSTDGEIAEFVAESEGVQLLSVLYERDAAADALPLVMAWWRDEQEET